MFQNRCSGPKNALNSKKVPRRRARGTAAQAVAGQSARTNAGHCNGDLFCAPGPCSPTHLERSNPDRAIQSRRQRCRSMRLQLTTAQRAKRKHLLFVWFPGLEKKNKKQTYAIRRSQKGVATRRPGTTETTNTTHCLIFQFFQKSERPQKYKGMAELSRDNL